jgi:hypothetical protein
LGGQKHPVPHQNVDIAFSISSFGLELLLLSLEPSVSRPKPTARIPEHALKNYFSIRGGGARLAHSRTGYTFLVLSLRSLDKKLGSADIPVEKQDIEYSQVDSIQKGSIGESVIRLNSL